MAKGSVAFSSISNGYTRLSGGFKALGGETLRTESNILSDIAENKVPDVRTGDIVSKHVTEYTQKLIQKLRARRRKLTATTSRNKRKLAKKPRLQKEISSPKSYQSLPDHYCRKRVRDEWAIFAPRPVQSLIVKTTETACKPITSVDQSDLEFLIPADHDTYIDSNIHIYIYSR